jgi:nitroreductase
MTMETARRVPVRELITLACRAPSVHNSQPWRWVVDGEQVTLFADHSRQLVYADPVGRDLVISCGAALHHLQVAAAAAGWTALVRRMPNPHNDAQVANVSFEPCAVSREAREAADALARRRTDRRSTSSWPVARETLAPLLGVAGRAGTVAFAVVSAQAKSALLQLLAEADAVQRRNPKYLTEITGWVGADEEEGIPLGNLLDHAPAVGDHHGAATRFPSGTLVDTYLGDDEPAETLIAICTSSDDAVSRLRAGEALSAVLLKSTALGLSTMPLSQAIEVDRTRQLLQGDLLKDVACPQILVRIGWLADNLEQLPATPRRPVTAVVSEPQQLPAFLGPYLP